MPDDTFVQKYPPFPVTQGGMRFIWDPKRNTVKQPEALRNIQKLTHCLGKITQHCLWNACVTASCQGKQECLGIHTGVRGYANVVPYSRNEQQGNMRRAEKSHITLDHF